MMKAFLLALMLLVSMPLQAFSGRDAWKNSNLKERMVLLKHYVDFYSEYTQSEASTYSTLEGEQRTTYLNFFQEAWIESGKPDCIYAGWPSQRVGGLCSSPVRHNPSYEKGSCQSNQLQCQPLLFGKGHCVPAGTREERQYAFSNCEKKFAASGKSLENVIREIKDNKKENELFELMDFADGVCREGAQSSTPMCKKLKMAVERIRLLVGEKKTPDVEVRAQPQVRTTTGDRNIPAEVVTAVRMTEKANETVAQTRNNLIECIPDNELIPFDRDEPRPIDLGHVSSTTYKGWEHTYRVDKSGDKRLSGFRFKNRGPNSIAGKPLDPDQAVEREWHFVNEDGSKRETYLWITDDAGSGYLSQLMETVILLVPRKTKPEVREVGDELHVILTTGEKVVYDKATRQVKAGALKEGPVDLNPNRHNRKFADVQYQGSGISIRINKRGEDPRLTGGQAVVTQNGKSCQVPVGELWNKEAEFRFADDKKLLEHLNRRCAGKFSL